MENSLKNMCKAFLSNQTCVHCKGTPKFDLTFHQGKENVKENFKPRLKTATK